MVVFETSPYAWPFSNDLLAARVALVVAGADAGWADRSTGAGECLRLIRGLAGEVAVLGGLVVRIAHRGASGDPARPLDLPAQVAIDAVGLDGFYNTSLDDALRTPTRPLVVFAGFGLEGPVHSTLRSANDRGYECLTLRDACAAVDPACENAAYSTIEMSGGIFGAVGTSASFLTALHLTVPLEVE
jgi:hypothetical protein